MNVEPSTPLIGAEVSGVDLANLSDNEFGALKDAFTKHSVLFFRDQPELAPDAQVEFAKDEWIKNKTAHAQNAFSMQFSVVFALHR